MNRKIYLASSWRNPHYEGHLSMLRLFGHEVYDFKNPAPKRPGFSWSQIEGFPPVETWGPLEMVEVHKTQRAKEGFFSDMSGLKWCDTCILLMPAGRSAHLEFGWACAANKSTHVMLMPEKFEPDLMHMMADYVHTSFDELIEALK